MTLTVHPRVLRKYDNTGSPVNNARVRELGFDVGVQVYRKADEVIATVDEIKPEVVTLKMPDDSLVTVSSESFISGKWRRHSEKPQPTLLVDWWTSSPASSPEFLAATIKGRVMLAMLQQYEAWKHEKSLQIFTKPKDVQALKVFPSGALQVPIASSRVDVRPSSQDGLQGSIRIGCIKGLGQDLSVYIVPSVTFPKDNSTGFLNPAWIMKASSEKTECNVELVGPSKTWANQRLDKLTSVVQLPCIKNFRKIDIEDSLVFYRPGLARTEAVEQLVPVNPVAKKKAKTS